MARKLTWGQYAGLIVLATVGLFFLREYYYPSTSVSEQIAGLPWPLRWGVEAIRWAIAIPGVILAAVLFLFFLPALFILRYVFVPYARYVEAWGEGDGLIWLVGAIILLAMGAGIVAFAFAASWAIWSTIIPRTLSYVGLWDPFWAVDRRPRRWLLIAWVKLNDWLEIVRKFGRGATAGWAGFAEVLSHGYRKGDIFLGRPSFFFGMMRPIGISAEKHFITIAGPGSGKSTAAIIPNLCLHEGSLLCIDPKGELATITAGSRRMLAMGQEVQILDPYRIVSNWASTSSYNVFDELARVEDEDPDSTVSYAGKIAEALVKSNPNAREPFWDNAAKTLIRGLILYVFVHEPKRRKNLVRVRELLVEGDFDGHAEALMAGVASESTTPFDVLLEKMKLARGGRYGSVIAGTALTLERMEGKQGDSVISTAQEHTSFLDAPEIQRTSLKSSFLLADLKAKPMSVYVCLPLNSVTGKEGAWLRMFVVLLVDMMSRSREVPNPPILIAIDEFPNLGPLDGIETVGPTLRSQGVRLWVVGQDISQFEAVYPKTWSGFIGNAEAVQFMGVTHPATIDFLVGRLSRHEVVSVRQGQRFSEEKPLLDRDQVARILARKRGHQIIWRGEERPMLLKTTPYFKYLAWWYYDPDPRYREQWARRFWRSRYPPPWEAQAAASEEEESEEKEVGV